MTKEQCIGLISDLAVAFEGQYPCKCAELHTPDNPKLVTGHVQGCPVDEAVRLDLAKAGIV